ncbi:MAG: hypothetical protein IJB15_13570, partial [Clostridia bacterium]|nr:hypothetical protein [Clostridia bacterium]
QQGQQDTDKAFHMDVLPIILKIWNDCIFIVTYWARRIMNKLLIVDRSFNSAVSEVLRIQEFSEWMNDSTKNRNRSAVRLLQKGTGYDILHTETIHQEETVCSL